MDPNLVPPAPPPLQPVTPGNNPYEFITQLPPSKRKLLSGGGSKKQRILIVLGGLLVLAIVAAIFVGVLSNGSKGPVDDYQSLIEQQTELVRVSAVGMAKAQQAEAKNIAITTNYSLTSEQADLLALAKKTGAKTDAKNLALGKDNQTDTLLASAAQNNQFDSVFTVTLQKSLKKYQATLKKIYDETTAKTTKDILSKDYTNANILVGSPAP